MGVGDRAWMQTDPELVASCALQSLKKMKHLVSILNYPWFFVTISLDVQSEHWVGPLQTLQFICWEGGPKWIFWFARVLCCVNKHERHKNTEKAKETKEEKRMSPENELKK